MIKYMVSLWHWHPPVGVWIGVLGFLGVLVPLIRDLNRIGRREKALWTLVVFVLLLLEIKSVYQDRKEHDAEQAAIRREESEHFERIAQGIENSNTHREENFQATLKQSDALILAAVKIMGLSKDAIGSITGGDSFVYFRLLPTDNPNVTSVWEIHHGRYPLSDVTARITDLSEFRKAVAVRPTDRHSTSECPNINFQLISD